MHKAVQDMYPPGACIFMRRLKAKIVKKERKRAEREARRRERREHRDVRRQEKQDRKVQCSLRERCKQSTPTVASVDSAYHR